jgi:hypothetical protein
MKKLAQTALTATLDKIYECPSGGQTDVKSISLCNVTGSAVTVTLCSVPTGGTAGTGNAILYAQSIGANKTLGIKCDEGLTSLDFISASGLGVTITINGEERR